MNDKGKERKRALFIYNPRSGRKSQHRQLSFILQTLCDLGYHIDLHHTTCAGNIQLPVKKACINGWEAIFVAGGDGTVNHVIQTAAAQEHRPLIGLFPFGTSNEFATFIGMPVDVRQSLSVIATQHTKYVDIGQFGNTYFVNIAAGGWLTDITYKTPLRLKSCLGEWAYYLYFIKEFLRNRPDAFSIQTAPDHILPNVSLFMIMNGNAVGPFEHLIPNACVDDGYFHLVTCQKATRLQLLYSLVSLMLRKSCRSPYITSMKIRSTEVSMPQQMALNVDGEQASFTGGKFQVHPRHLRFFAPVDVSPKS